MRNIKLTLAYDGTGYSGWQSQKKGERTVQDTLGAALERFTGQETRPVGSGRTDAGVHALCLVATFRTTRQHDTATIKRALNALLPPDVRVLEASEVSAAFHPLRATKLKRYSYLIDNSPEPWPFHLRYAWHLQEPLEAKAMQEALACLRGKHDFRAFMASGSSVSHTIREITETGLTLTEGLSYPECMLEVAAPRRRMIRVDITGTGFLKQMVRNIVGTLVMIGQGRLKPVEMARILSSQDRKQAGPTAPPQGLFMAAITIQDDQGEGTV